MILWGTSEKKLNEGQIGQVNCPICEDKTMMQYVVFAKRLNIFWIPTIPLRKRKILECNTCGEFSFLKQFPKRFQNKFKTEVSSTYPIWYYSGLILTVLLISILSVLLNNRNISDQKLIDYPAIGDIYTIKVDKPKEHKNDYSSHYTLMKVINVTNDSVTVILNTETMNKVYGYYRIDKPEYYNVTMVEQFSKSQLKSLYKTKYIKAVNRQ